MDIEAQTETNTNRETYKKRQTRMDSNTSMETEGSNL